jgi:hypothetical protein
VIAAYADPPYIGYSKYYKDDPRAGEVDHAELITRLDRDYEAWALSCHTTSLGYLLSLCPEGIRVGAWVKPFCSWKKNVNPAYAWEPVIFKPGRKPAGDTVRDWISDNMSTEKGLVGAKPEGFCFWVFQIMGLLPEDELVDLYPGSGAVGRAWEKYCGDMFCLIQATGTQDRKDGRWLK